MPEGGVLISQPYISHLEVLELIYFPSTRLASYPVPISIPTFVRGGEIWPGGIGGLKP